MTRNDMLHLIDNLIVVRNHLEREGVQSDSFFSHLVAAEACIAAARDHLKYIVQHWHEHTVMEDMRRVATERAALYERLQSNPVLQRRE